MPSKGIRAEKRGSIPIAYVRKAKFSNATEPQIEKVVMRHPASIRGAQKAKSKPGLCIGSVRMGNAWLLREKRALGHSNRNALRTRKQESDASMLIRPLHATMDSRSQRHAECMPWSTEVHATDSGPPKSNANSEPESHTRPSLSVKREGYQTSWKVKKDFLALKD